MSNDAMNNDTMNNDAMNLPIDAVAAAGRAIADAFQLGDEATASDNWPSGDEITVFGATVHGGGVEGALLLAVDADTAERIATDTDMIATAFQHTLDALTGTTGLPLELGEFGTVDATPSHIIEIRSDGRATARFGIVLEAAAAAGDSQSESGATNFQPAPLTNDGAVRTPSTGPLSLLQDVEMNVTVELGRTTMPIRDLLSLQPGMVVEIDRAASAPIDVLVNGRLIACGEVVVIDEEFGIRITEIVSGRAST